MGFERAVAKLPISPLAGEMPGRAEGGAVPLTFGCVLEQFQVGDS
ncbi:hypothetical protein X771_18945 [Mesorhizobium sp. LSJC277A00]|nr:hypothetical protein X771_18945 [Mesorhizobium sp. LSJC277A00]ESZ02956.1 hypothetical protein X736_28140 [Mesorhizobium sp. L2C089B000]ESZ65260.1 hypothetical protein X728_07080 [Mesorhizobium sp. L103C120A0]